MDDSTGCRSFFEIYFVWRPIMTEEFNYMTLFCHLIVNWGFPYNGGWVSK